MASAPIIEESLVSAQKRIRPRKRGPVRLVDDKGKAIPEAVLVDITKRMDARRLRDRLARLEKRHRHAPERMSIEKAMLAVEERIVKAYWVLARLPDANRAIGFAPRNGVDYMMDRADKWAAAVAGGGWLSERPRPAPPEREGIDAMWEPFEWLRWLEDSDARVLAAGAIWKRGDAGRNVNWIRVKGSRKELANFTVDQLKVKYRQGLREIVAELTARAGEKFILERNTN